MLITERKIKQGKGIGSLGEMLTKKGGQESRQWEDEGGRSFLKHPIAIWMFNGP